MGSTSPTELAETILARCLAGAAVPDGLLETLAERAGGMGPEAEQASAALFQGVVEPLADRFEPALCDSYASLFSRVLGGFVADVTADGLRRRYERVRRARRWEGSDPERVVVLSRVTLGADVAITSVILDGVKRRFPDAEILLAGGRKNWELFAADPRVGHLAIHYRRRGSLRERLAAGAELRDKLAGADTVVVDPDSRLTQLGLLPVCADERYWFFESRSAGGAGTESLTRLTSRWVAETFGVEGARPYVASEAVADAAPAAITVSYGVGENPRKRLDDPFEAELLRGLLETGLPVLIDKGPGGEEAERVERAIAAAGGAGRVAVWEGAFAPFAARIAASRLYVGYDSAGQHVAAAAGVPLVVVFAGHPGGRFFERWRPAPSAEAISLQMNDLASKEAACQVLTAARRLLLFARAN